VTVLGQAQAERPAHDDPHLLAFIREHGGRNGERAVALIAAWKLLSPQARAIAKRLTKRDVFTITVPGTDDVYTDLHEWVLQRLPEADRKALIATSIGVRELRHIDSSDDERKPPKLHLRYDGERQHTVSIDGHRVTVMVNREAIPGRDNIPDNWRALTEKITFTATNTAGRDAVVRMIEGLLAEKYSRKGPPPLLMPSRWGGGWQSRSDLPPRPLESVILKAGQLERLVDDLDGFLNAEDEYGRLSQPWHRGYLFHGPPGTGKTSIARALANHFDLATYYLPLGDLERDADLVSLVSSIRPRSVLLIEDVDVFHAATERSDSESKTSVAAMLNALDGVWTPHGLITVMTTNRRDTLDDALIRAGRVDVEEELSVLDEDQASRLAAWLGVDDTPASYVGSDPASMIQSARSRTTVPA
jgi:hypothetical protein